MRLRVELARARSAVGEGRPSTSLRRTRSGPPRQERGYGKLVDGRPCDHDGRACSLTVDPSRLLPRRVEEHAVAGPAADHAALDLLFLGIPDLDPHLAARLRVVRRHAGKGDVLLQLRRPEGRGGEADLLLRRLVGIEEGARRGLAPLDLDARSGYGASGSRPSPASAPACRRNSSASSGPRPSRCRPR